MEFYIGSRTCKCHPTMDNYKGSMMTWKPDRNMLRKFILADNFTTRKEAMIFEANLIVKNINNPLNMNFSIPGKNFHTVGMCSVVDLRGNIFLVNKNDERIQTGELRHIWVGKKHTKEARGKMSESAKNRKITDEMERLRRENISKTLKGVQKSEDFRKNMSLTRRGENNPYSKFLKSNNIQNPNKGKKYEKLECPHCKRMIAKSVIHISHLDNCKMKKDV
jgi:hypothetical protein